MHGAATYEYYMCGTIVMYCNYIYIQISSVLLHGCFQCPALQVLYIPYYLRLCTKHAYNDQHMTINRNETNKLIVVLQRLYERMNLTT